MRTLILINLITFAVFAWDKRQAIRGEWRVSEKALFFLAALGGSLGGMMAMYTFHHKTRKPLFKYGMPMLLAAQIVILRIL